MPNSKERRIIVTRHLPYVPDLSDANGWMPRASLELREAEPLARRLNETHLKDVEFKYFFTTGLVRATETLKLLRPGAQPIIVSEAIGPGNYDDWTDIFLLDLQTPAECYEQAPALMEERGRLFRLFVNEVGLSMNPGENALMCSHGPLIDALTATLLDRWPPPTSIEKGELVVITICEDGHVRYQHLPLI